MSVAKLHNEIRELQEGLGRIAVWWQLLDRAMNHLDVTPEELCDIPSDVAMVVQTIQNNSEAIAANWETFQQTLLRIVVVRAGRPGGNQFGLANALSCAIIQATIDMKGLFDSTLVPESAESGEMSEMADVIHQIAKAETNGDAFVVLSGYRKSVRARVIDQCTARLAEEQAVRSSHLLDSILSEKAQDSSSIVTTTNNDDQHDGA